MCVHLHPKAVLVILPNRHLAPLWHIHVVQVCHYFTDQFCGFGQVLSLYLQRVVCLYVLVFVCSIFPLWRNILWTRYDLCMETFGLHIGICAQTAVCVSGTAGLSKLNGTTCICGLPLLQWLNYDLKTRYYSETYMKILSIPQSPINIFSD